MRIGFIGIGNMGSGMIGRLREAGHAIATYARSERSRRRAREMKLEIADSPERLAGSVDGVITMVTGGADVEELVLGPHGVAAGARPGLTVIDMSTVSPTVARTISAALGEKGVGFLDAPVSGSVAAAAAGALTLFVGGEREVYQRMRPLLEHLGRMIFYMGGPGAGQATKLANQIAQLANIQGAAEALLFAARQGVDPGAVREAVLTGLGSSRMLELLGKKMVERDFEAGIVAALHHKDLGVALQLAHEAGFALPGTAQVMQQLNALMGQGWGHQDTSSLLRVLEQTAGGAPRASEPR